MKLIKLSWPAGTMLAALATALPASAEPGKAAQIPVETFAQLPAMNAVSLSRAGRYLAYRTPSDGRTFLVLMERASGKKVALPPISEAEIAWYRWVSDHGLLISYGFENQRVGFGGKIHETRLAYFDAKKGKFSWLVKDRGAKYTNSKLKTDVYTAQFQDNIIDFLPDDPENVLQAIDSDWDGDYEVRRLNVTNGRFSVVHDGFRGVQNWVTDRSHTVRYGFGAAERLGRVARYLTSGGTWVDAETLKWHQDGYSLIRFTDDPAVAYVSGPTGKGTDGLLKMNLDTSQVLESVFEDDRFDVDGLIYAGPDGDNGMPADGQPIAAAYTADLPELHFFDPAAAKLQATIDKLLPGTRNLIVSQVPEEKLYLILARGNTDAGLYYLLDLKKKSLDPLAERMPGLTPEHMSATRALSYPARDGTDIPGYLTLPQGSDGKNLPTILFVHGGPGSRDDMTFDPWVQLLASRGYAVFQPNFRGSTGYGQAYAAAGHRQWGGLMQHDVEDAAKWLKTEGIAAEDRLCIVGGSYGGYVAALSAAVTPDLYRCAVSINGVLDLPDYISNGRYRYVGGKANVDHIGLEGADPETVSPQHLADRVSIPLLLIAAKDDAQVEAKHSENMYGKLKGLGKAVEYLELEDGGHRLDTEAASVAALSRLEAFLGQHLAP